ncbi:MAG: 50S ribosomal protein L6 [Burkholderiaceae bacterium]|nr:MAG: 50S ribosomal protein L6 [Burkholderiaceae bacterium]
MSRVAKRGVAVPEGVNVQVKDDQVSVKGKGGEMTLVVHPSVRVVAENGHLKFTPANESNEANALSGTMCQLVRNMVVGVTHGFEKKLELQGVGFRAQAQGSKLNLSVGFSHPVVIEMPAGLKVETPSATEILVKGSNRQAVGQIAAEIRAVRPPEPYKGKGIRYSNEKIVLKETKKK